MGIGSLRALTEQRVDSPSSQGVDRAAGDGPLVGALDLAKSQPPCSVNPRSLDACGLCGRDPAAGFATIDDVRYCHGDFDPDPTCYMQAERMTKPTGSDSVTVYGRWLPTGGLGLPEDAA